MQPTIDRRGILLVVASNETGWIKTAKNADFRPINRHISEKIKDKFIVTIED